MLTYLLTKEDLTPEEVNGHAIDVVAGGVDTVCGVLCVFVMMSTNIEKNSAVSEEVHVLTTAYGFYLFKAWPVCRSRAFEIPFPN